MNGIAKIVLKFGETEISMTLEQAKELQKILNEAFGVKETIYVQPYIGPYRPYYPYWDSTTSGSTVYLKSSND